MFTIKQEDIRNYNPWCYMSSGLMLDYIIMNLFSDITEQKNNSAKMDLFSKTKDDKIYLYQGYLQDYSQKKIIADTKKTLRTHHFIEKDILKIFICGLLSIFIDEEDIENKTN